MTQVYAHAYAHARARPQEGPCSPTPYGPLVKTDELVPSPELTRRMRVVLSNLFGMVCEHVHGIEGNLLRMQKGRADQMIADLNDDLAFQMAGGLLTVADFVSAPIAKAKAIESNVVQLRHRKRA